MSDEWCVELPGGPVKLDVGTQGNPFIHHLTRHVVRAYPGIGALEIRGGFEETFVGFRDGRLRSVLRLVPGDKGVIASVLGRGGQDGQVEPWAEAVEWARRHHRETEEFWWWAVVSADAEWQYTPSPELAREARVGTIRLIPSGFYTEAGPTAFVHSRRAEKSVQLVVAGGSVRSHEFFPAIEAATAELRVVCGLLALVSGSPWSLRSMPQVVDRDFDPRQVDLRGWGTDVRPEARALELPEAMDKAHATVRAKPWLSQLVSAYQEALELAVRHESFAVIGFVSIVEQVGNRRAGKLPTCSTCGAITESGKRFRESLRRVMAPELADRLGGYAYDLRSRTAHAGRLHGRETSFGLFSPGGHLASAKLSVFPTLLYQMQLAAGRLLRLEVGLDAEAGG